MKKLLITVTAFLLSLLTSSPALAQQTCAPPQETVIFFGNGVNAEDYEAKESLKLLRTQLTDTYNGQKLSYDLAYNSTYTLWLDLPQSALQLGVQFDSSIAQWLSDTRLALKWFTDWYQTVLSYVPVVIANDVVKHVQSYKSAIAQGKKVLVVSHSQGNFYVNEAKKLLALELTPAQMQNFAIFGVAVPADNVGGAPGPYYTNHRDFIYQVVPGSLPANWTLKRADGSSADNLGALDAHFFNPTYLSLDYDIRPALLTGIQSQLSALQAATAGGSCNDANNNYRKHFLSLVAGSYASACNTPFVASDFTIDANATFSALGQTVDASGVDAYVALTQSFATGGIYASAVYSPVGKPNQTAVVNWVQSGLYYLGGLELPGVARVSCAGNPIAPTQVAASYIPNKLDITNDVLALLADKRRVFPKSTCVSNDPGAPLVSNVRCISRARCSAMATRAWISKLTGLSRV
jgi:hypothetical protein